MVRRVARPLCWMVLALGVLVWGASEVWYVHRQRFDLLGVKLDEVRLARGSLTIAVNGPPGYAIDPVFAGTVDGVGRIDGSVGLARLWLPRVAWRFGYGVTLPLWMPIALSVACLTARHWLPRHPHRCGSCKYDLSGTTLPVCPECGMRRA